MLRSKWIARGLVLVGIASCTPASSQQEGGNNASAARAALPSDAFLSLAGAGWKGCIIPNEIAKTCNTLLEFKFMDGRLSETSSTVTMPTDDTGGYFVLTASQPARFTGLDFCSRFTPDLVDRAGIEFVSREATANEIAEIRRTLKTNMEANPSQEVCMRLVGSESATRVESRVNGLHNPAYDEPWKWIEPDGDWTIG